MSIPDHLPSLLDEEQRLQREAADVRDALGIDELLRGVGTPNLVGACALGVMVNRDIDITVVCEALDIDPVLDVAARLARSPSVRSATVRNDTGAWNTNAGYPDGLYIGVDCRSGTGAGWNLDIWFVDEPDRQPDLAHLAWYLPRLTDEARARILVIKQVEVAKPGYHADVHGIDIYRAVLDHGVRTPDEFDDHRRRTTP